MFEHRFWLQILGDHSRFILDNLSPKELDDIQRAQYFIHAFDSLLAESRKSLSDAELSQLNVQAIQQAEHLRMFKLHLLARHLQGEITIGLPPTFINHMVNELDEYLTILMCLLEGKMPPVAHPLHHHLLWLPDAAGHAGAINDNLDAVEKDLKEKSHAFTVQFEQFYLKAIELAGYLRTNLIQFPALTRFNHETELELLLFKEFLRELEKMEINNTVLGTLQPLLADHMTERNATT